MASEKTYKAIIYDLDIEALEKHYDKSDYHYAYKEIGRFFRKNDFRWIEGSGYFSNNRMSKYQIRRLFLQLKEELPWTDKCIRDCRQLDVTKENNTSIYFERGREEIARRREEDKILKMPPQLTPNGRVDIDAKLAEYKKKRIAEGTLKPSMQNKCFHR